MKIGFDAKRMLNNPTGLGNHARILLNALMRDFPDNDYLLFSPKAKDEFLNQLHGDFHLHFPETKYAQSLHSWWRSYGLTKQLIENRIELYHGLSNELPLNIHRARIKKVVTIHDLIFLKHKDQYPWIDRQVYTLKTRYAAKHADAIIAVSEETKQDLIKMYSVPEKKIHVIYQSVDEKFYKPVADDGKKRILSKYKLPARYILNVSSFYPRKNQLRLIEAFDRIKDKVVENLVLIGNSGGMLNQIKSMIISKGLQQRIQVLTDVSNDELPAMYQSAALFVFPSLLEGYGMPVLEAAFSGVPVIATKGGAIEEAARSGAVFIDPYNIADIESQMLNVLQNENVRNKMIALGYEHAQMLTDTLFARETMKLYQKLLNY